jgi:hypothetical protein
MIIVISIGTIVTALLFLFGFIFAVYILEKVINSLNEFITILKLNIPHINNFNIQLFLLFLIGSIVILLSNIDMSEHRNKNNEKVYRKDWQKILDILNVAMIYPVLKHFNNINISDTIQKIYMLFFAVIFLFIFVISHYYNYLNNKYSKIDFICHYLYKLFIFLASVFISIFILSIYSLFIYIHDFSNANNIFLSIFYYIFLLLPLIPYSFIFFPSIENVQKKGIKTVFLNFLLCLVVSLILGFSSFFNLFIKNSSIYSIHSLILIDILLILLFSIVFLPITIYKSIKNNGLE